MFNYQKNIGDGRKAGYSEYFLAQKIEYLREFVIWKENNQYKGYFFSIPTQYMNCIEDFPDTEEYFESEELSKIISLLEQKGLLLHKINIFKGSSLI